MPADPKPALRIADVEDLAAGGDPIVFAVDQPPFEVGNRGVKNTFCLLIPLLTEDGRKLDLTQFPNRERVWWMLRQDIDPAQVRVGMLWTGPIERSREYGSGLEDKDHYQVRRADVRPGAARLVEVLNLKVAHPNLEDLLDPGGMQWSSTTLGRVVLRGGLSVVGPFRASHDSVHQRLHLQAVTPGSPTVYRMPRAEFESRVRPFELAFTSRQFEVKGRASKLEVTLLCEEDLQILEREGERLDGATDSQIVNWALDLLEVPKRERVLFKEILERARGLGQRAEVIGFEERLERFFSLCGKRERLLELGSKVAAAVAKEEAFAELVSRHVETITAERVAKEIEARRQEIAAASTEAEGRLAQLRERVAGLQEEYARQLEARERDFQEKNAERLRAIEERERTVTEQEKAVEARLAGLVAAYRDEAGAFSDRLIAEIPVLQRLGVLGGPGMSPAAGAQRPARLELPAFLAESRPRANIREEELLDGLEGLVAARGFVFEREDLVNFHVLVKTGVWTVLTGQSGLGKSSLPRLYAEALGCPREFLLVPVRPDWLDDRDVAGAFNALSGRFESAPCGLVERLITAAEDLARGRGGIYIVCLDEMNLARVEHYFAQFLSVLEQPPGARWLELFSPGLGSLDDPYLPYRRLPLGDNLRLVGTVNIDETTHFFSPKVIDRAAIAAFERPNLRLGLTEERPAVPRLEPVRLEDLQGWVRPADRGGEVVDLVVTIDDALGRSRLGLGFRRRDRILRYVSSARHLLGEDRAVDLALLQNVVPALRPSAPRYEELLRELRGLLPPGRFRRTAAKLATLAEDPDSDYFQLL